MKFQYQTQVQTFTPGQIHETLYLNQQGALGWELCSVVDQHGSRVYYFRREISDIPPVQFQSQAQSFLAT